MKCFCKIMNYLIRILNYILLHVITFNIKILSFYYHYIRIIKIDIFSINYIDIFSINIILRIYI